jgi:putative Holliday junction resolvase
MRLLALDVGNRRIGIAVSDPTGFLASAERVLKRVSIAKDMAALSDMVRAYEAEAVVVGLPLHLDGRRGEQADSVQRFVERLKSHISVPIILWDERLSTRGAQALLIEAGMGAAQRAAHIDAAAAAVILQNYLDYQRQKKQRGVVNHGDTENT